jgi:uncharacterized phage-associated protein
MHSVLDVARYLLRKTGPLTSMKLQKLVYYCQAWSLVWDEKPLFKEKIEAWANGPVVSKLFAEHRGQYIVSARQLTRGNARVLDTEEKATIAAVIDYYGDKSSQWLSDLTHNEDPWKKAREGLCDGERSCREISRADMVEYYSSIPEEL